MMCLTGGNGYGKSTLFKLISMAIGEVGFSASSPVWSNADRNNVFSITLDLSDEPDEFWSSEPHPEWPQGWKAANLLAKWDKTIVVSMSLETRPDGKRIDNRIVTIPGMDRKTATNHFLPWLSGIFDTHDELKHLHLQSDRSFDEDHQAFRLELGPTELKNMESLTGKKISSYKSSRDLYDEWIEFTTHIEAKRLLDARRSARTAGFMGLSNYEDPLASLNTMVCSVLPHISVAGINLETKKLVIRSRDMEIDFQGLSGGEREILFLCGQIDRLRLTKGILLIDEPELHLNPDLLRRFLTMIQQTAGEGQLWLATHSYEAIEAAGESNAFVMESSGDEDTTLTSLRSQPVIKTLSAALGRVGFGLSNTVFVIVEGSKDSIRERQRYSELVGRPNNLNFVAIGEGKRDVKRMLAGLMKVAEASGEQLNVKAVVDSDFDSLEPGANEGPRLYQLRVHEVENLFLEPLSLEAGVRDIIRPDQPWNFEELIRDQARATAGRWIWDRVQYKCNSRWKKDGKGDLAQQCRRLISERSWQDIQTQKKELALAIADIDESIAGDVRSGIGNFPKILTSSDLWKHCFGKETLRAISRQVGFVDHEMLERAVISAWNQGRASRPQELTALREFLQVVD